MSELVPVSKTPLKVFIASAAEMEEERTTSRLIFDGLNDTHEHLFIRGFDWKYNMPHGNNPGYDNIQSAITDKYLQDAPVVVFIFYSRIGIHTREEFEYAMANNKRVFVYFKKGFSPTIDTLDEFRELLQFLKSLNETVLYDEYQDIYEFKLLLSDNLTLFINQTPALASPDKQNAHELKEQLAQQEKIRKELEQELAPQKERNALKAQALEEIKKGDYAAAEEHLKQSAKESIIDAASTYFELGKIKQIQLFYNEAYSYFELAAKMESNNALYLNEAGKSAENLGFYDVSLDYFKRALSISINLYGQTHPDIATIYINIGLLYEVQGEYDKAIELYNKALIIYHNVYHHKHDYMAVVYNSLGLAFFHKGEFNEAIKNYNKALTILESLRSENHSFKATLYNNLGGAFDSMRDFNLAITYYEKALAINIKYLNKNHPDIARDLNNLSLTYNSIGEHEKAIEECKKALDILKKIYGEKHPKVAIAYNNVGELFRTNGDYDNAIIFFKKALHIDNFFFTEGNPITATHLNNLGLAYHLEGNLEEAIVQYQLALSSFIKFLPSNHPSIQMVEDNLQSALAAQAAAKK